MGGASEIRRAQSCNPDAREAAREFHDAVAQPDMTLVLFFCSVQYDLEVLAAELRRLFDGVQVVGSTTAGEIGPMGYRDHSICGLSLSTHSSLAAYACIDSVHSFEFTRARALGQDLMQRVESDGSRAGPDHMFALLLIDGLSVREEPVARALQSALGEIPLVGGSAGDGLAFGQTLVYCDGAFRTDAAVVVLVATALPFRVFKTQHFAPTEDRVVVTAADAEHRIIWELDGWPAADGYNRLVGGGAVGLDPLRFAEQPLVVLIDGTNYVRSIQQANPDGSLTLYCAIEEGLVLRAARGVNILQNLGEAFARVRAEIGPIQLTIGFDCILRKIELAQRGLVEPVGAILRDNCFVGFSTYGEQYRGVHVNQTLTGVAIGGIRDG